jgi:hypothetical protein
MRAASNSTKDEETGREPDGTTGNGIVGGRLKIRSAAVAEKRCPKMFEEVSLHLPVNAEQVPHVPEKAPRTLLSIFTPSPRCGYLGGPLTGRRGDLGFPPPSQFRNYPSVLLTQPRRRSTALSNNVFAGCCTNGTKSSRKARKPSRPEARKTCRRTDKS